MNRTLIAMALLLGTPLSARADIVPHPANGDWSEALNIRGTACFDTPGEQTRASVHLQTARQCRRDPLPRRSASEPTGDGKFACIADVLDSEELAGAPIFYRHVRSALLVTSRGRPAFETTVERLIPWQVPPLRKGQRLRLWCDSASPGALTSY
jgi:hypothetical protein